MLQFILSFIEMPYIPPSKRVAPAPPALDIKSEKAFPSLGGGTVACARHVGETSLASRAAAWNEASSLKDPNRESRLREQSLEDAKDLLRIFYQNSPKMPEYIRSDDIYQDRLDELDYLAALEYDKENGPPAGPLVSEWGVTVRSAPRQRTTPTVTAPPPEEVDDAALRNRIEFLKKKMRRNGLLREEKDTYEAELRDLQRQLYDSD